GALWALCPETKQLARLDIDQWKASGSIALPSSPIDFDIAESDSPADGLAAASLGEAGEVALVDLRQGRLRQRIRIGGHLGKVRFRKDGKQLLIASLNDRQLLIYDLAAGRITVRLPLAVRPDRFCMLQDGGQMFITGEGMDGLVTVYPYQTEVRGTVLAGHSPGFVAASVEPPYLFVANQQSGDVTIINVTTQKVMAVARVGKDPSFIAITPNDEYALVLNRGSGDMAVLHIGTLTATRTKAAPLFTMVPVGSGPVSAVVRTI
ncbi:MAG: YncE family protein, partial [Acidobacteriia bacterium]|nr:YncE family protein [Terriglobia bacterium]